MSVGQNCLFLNILFVQHLEWANCMNYGCCVNERDCSIAVKCENKKTHTRVNNCPDQLARNVGSALKILLIPLLLGDAVTKINITCDHTTYMQQCDDDSRLSALHSDGADGRGLRHRRSGVRAVCDAAWAYHRWAITGSFIVLHASSSFSSFVQLFFLHQEHSFAVQHIWRFRAWFSKLCRVGIFRSSWIADWLYRTCLTEPRNTLMKQSRDRLLALGSSPMTTTSGWRCHVFITSFYENLYSGIQCDNKWSTVSRNQDLHCDADDRICPWD